MSSRKDILSTYIKPETDYELLNRFNVQGVSVFVVDSSRSPSVQTQNNELFRGSVLKTLIFLSLRKETKRQRSLSSTRDFTDRLYRTRIRENLGNSIGQLLKYELISKKYIRDHFIEDTKSKERTRDGLYLLNTVFSIILFVGDVTSNLCIQPKVRT